jgi:hypothetical protein
MISTFGEDDQHNLYLADYFRGIIYQIQDSLAAWTPTFSPTGGVINSNTVIVTCLTTNAEIHYTTNGVNPTLSDPMVGSRGSITVAAGITYKARAYRTDLTPSGVASAVYTSLQVATPVFSPSTGPITNGTTISISCATPGASIYYTLDGSTPTTASPTYIGPFSINGGATIRTFAVETNYSNSSVQSINYPLVQVATPVFNPANGAVPPETPISISCATPGSTIYYTLDGSTPTTNSLMYSDPIMFQTNFVLEAFGFENGYNNSSVATLNYTLAGVATPGFNPSSGPITNGTLVSLSCSTTNSVIYYTVDGSAPTTNSAVYSSPFAINGGTTVSAFAVNFYTNSGTSTVTYLLKSIEKTIVTTVASGLSFPDGVCVDQNGNLYVSDGIGGILEILPFDQSTNIASINGPIGICVNSAGDFFLGDYNNEIWEVQQDGTAVVLAVLDGEQFGITQLAVDPGDNIYVGFSGSVQKVTPAGAIIPFASVAGWSTRVGVAMDAATNIYAATGNGVWRIAQNGTPVLYAGGNSGYADGPVYQLCF